MSTRGDPEERLALLGLGGEDVRALAALRPAIERHLEALLGAFFRHLETFAPMRALLAQAGVRERLHAVQCTYLRSLASDARDPSHAEECLRIGRTLGQIGVVPRWYVGAYARYFSMLASIVFEAHAADPSAIEHTLVALQRRILLDLQLAIEGAVEDGRHELELANRELTERCSELARELAEHQIELRKTAGRVRAAEQLASVAALVSGLAHEIGTPMSVIQGHADLLEATASDERERWRLQTIREQIDRISRIIQALLASARPRELVRAPVELAPLLERTLSFLAERLRRRSIQVETDLRPVPTVLADAEKLQQLFLNVFLNAADAMPAGGTLRVALAPLGGEEVEIRIADTGAGIDPLALDRIFEPFFTTKPAGQGSGLGLVVARGIVLDHEGTIDATSTPGAGTEFRIVLPLRSEVATAGL